MAANVETMMYVREKPWHGLGTMVMEAPTSADALRLAGLDWTVDQTPVYTDTGIEIAGYKANRRNSDNAILGIVSDRYKIVQNTEAFEFTDALIGETENGVVKYETAGSLCGGKRVWLLAKMPTQKILDDDVEPYMFFSNTHDGSGAIKVGITPVRIVCNNTLNIALNTAKRQWSTKHIGNMQSKLEEAKLCLQLADKYMKGLNEEADRFANATLYKEQIDEIFNEMFPIDDDTTERKKNNINEFKNEYYMCYLRPDIAQFMNTAWGAVNAMSDVVTHSAPKRNTANYAENRWGKIMDGHAIFDQFCSLVNQKISV